MFVYLLFNFRFDNNLIIVVIRRIFTHRTRSLVTLDSELLYKSQMHGETLGRNKWGLKTKEVTIRRRSLRQA